MKFDPGHVIKYEGKQAPSVIIYIIGVFKTIFLITGCPKNCPNFDPFSSMSEAQKELIYEVLIFQTLKKKG